MITYDRAKELLDYNSNNGVFTWMQSTSQRNPVGSVADFDKNGYHFIGIDGKDYPAHRLAWLLTTGDWPIQNIDHRDRDKKNNRITNLRDTSQSVNAVNATHRVDNTSGVRGVSWNKHRGMWNSYLFFKGLRVENKFNVDFFEACCLRKSWENWYGFTKIRSEV